ncbi:hypothetical protein JOF29_007478 [Kribbella aluminosa]|uniref:Uncharacterized protein n=1 Tax=Kribbella aluminosa TaxID=416017 RepID=A0ABS4UXI3_9ACTN|nr:hypothetical protein [Kribbella aluminosa]MBP2356368.1 hypothetical protein [Kribbella aluminosa]
MEFRADGTLVDYPIGRGDAPEAGQPGRWDTTGRLALTSGKTGRIVTSSPDQLDITWHP